MADKDKGQDAAERDDVQQGFTPPANMPKPLASLVEALAEGPLVVQRKEINYDVHSGQAAQAPNALLESFMVPASRWGSYEEMAEAEKTSAEARGVEPSMVKRKDGSWVRLVAEHLGGEPVVRDGVVYHRKRLVPRPVALSVAEAKQRRADTFDGGSWVRNGEKRESERFTAFAQHRGAQEFLEEASPTDAALVKTVQQRRERDQVQPSEAPQGAVVGADAARAAAVGK